MEIDTLRDTNHPARGKVCRGTRSSAAVIENKETAADAETREAAEDDEKTPGVGRGIATSGRCSHQKRRGTLRKRRGTHSELRGTHSKWHETLRMRGTCRKSGNPWTHETCRKHGTLRKCRTLTRCGTHWETWRWAVARSPPLPQQRLVLSRFSLARLNRHCQRQRKRCE